MDVFTMVVAIVAISTVAGLVSRWLKVSERMQSQSQLGSANEQQLRQEIAALRERVATLEQIVTDPGFELKRQIQALETRRAA